MISKEPCASVDPIVCSAEDMLSRFCERRMTTVCWAGLPLGASLRLSADAQAPGPGTVTDTLTVANPALVGGVQTDGTASTVALDGTKIHANASKAQRTVL